MSDRNLALRGRVKRVLKTKWGQESSDREVARKVECHRSLVTSCRLEMMALKLIPRVARERVPGEPCGGPGTRIRGGYVLDELGRSVRETVWLARRKSRAR